MKRRFSRHLVLALLCVGTLSACSIKLAYNNLDRLIRWQVSDYVDLNREQKRYLAREVEKVLRWHRTTQLPEYAHYLRGLPAAFSDSVTSEQLRGVFEQFMAWGDAVERRALPVAIALMSDLTDEQVAELPLNLERSNVELEEDEVGVDIETIRANWAEEYIDGMNRLLGRLNDEQKNKVNVGSLRYQPELVMWADYRRRWQADLLAILEQRQDVKAFHAAFTRLVDQRERYYGAEYAAVSAANQQLGRELAAAILSSMTDKQAARFADFVTELSDDFEALSRQT